MATAQLAGNGYRLAKSWQYREPFPEVPHHPSFAAVSSRTRAEADSPLSSSSLSSRQNSMSPPAAAAAGLDRRPLLGADSSPSSGGCLAMPRAAALSPSHGVRVPVLPVAASPSTTSSETRFDSKGEMTFAFSYL